MIDVRQTQAYARYLAGLGWKIIKADDGVSAFVRRVPLTPVSILKLQRPGMVRLDWLQEILDEERVVVSNTEPAREQEALKLLADGYRLSQRPFLPTKTYELGLGHSQKQLLSQMRRTTRENIRSYNRQKIEVRVVSGDELARRDSLLKALGEVYGAGRWGAGFQWSSRLRALVRAFGVDCFVVVAKRKQQLVAFSFYLTSQDTAEQYYSGSSDLGRKFKAPTICTWQGILEGKRRNLKRFDFGGIYDERFPIPAWKGFSQFKKGFGGVMKSYPGLYVKWNWPIKKG